MNAPTVQTESPAGVARDLTTYDWCDCSAQSGVTFWPEDDTSQSVTLMRNEDKRHYTHQYVKFNSAAKHITWKCLGTTSISQSPMNLEAFQWFSLMLYPEVKSPDGFGLICGKMTTRMRWNRYANTQYVSTIPFVSRTEGYDCFKIPAMLVTQAGTLIVFVEARKDQPGLATFCDDMARTDTVYKRSTDNGQTWGQLKNLIEESEDAEGVCHGKLVIGNIAPVQLRQSSKYPGRILVPYTRNNFKHYIVHSDDDGITFVGDRELKETNVHTENEPECDRNMSIFGLEGLDEHTEHLPEWIKNTMCNMDNPYHKPEWTKTFQDKWQWVGIGPPGGLQLQSGRILAPGYHSPIRGIHKSGAISLIPPISQSYNNFAVGHTLISDDDGDTWRLGNDWPIGEGANEHQYVELANGSVLANSRSLSWGSPQNRLQALSTDGGETFGESYYVSELPQSMNGCQGSTVGPGSS
jgi:sialidase-1